MLEIVAARRENAVCHRRDDTIADELLYPTGIAEVGRLLGYRLGNEGNAPQVRRWWRASPASHSHSLQRQSACQDWAG